MNICKIKISQKVSQFNNSNFEYSLSKIDNTFKKQKHKSNIIKVLIYMTEYYANISI